MTNVYHINGDSVSPCKATKGNCPYGQGEENNHFSDVGEAMAVLEYRLAKEYGGSTKAVSKKPQPTDTTAASLGTDGPKPEPVTLDVTAKTAKQLAAEGADPKAIREALRNENPSWGARQIHTVQNQMTSLQPSPAKTVEETPIPVRDPKTLIKNLDTSKKKHEALKTESRNLYEQMKAYDIKNAAVEGRAYFYGGNGKQKGVNPNGNTYFDKTEDQKNAIAAMNKKLESSSLAIERAQTEVEKNGYGHMLPDEGNTIRVRTQAQKWLLVNELQGQISDGHWENSSPQDHWQPWSNANVIVDPKNVGRNFHARKDNYQLNAKDLLEVVGDRMISEASGKMGESYDEKSMMTDLRDLRTIFKTTRQSIK